MINMNILFWPLALLGLPGGGEWIIILILLGVIMFVRLGGKKSVDNMKKKVDSAKKNVLEGAVLNKLAKLKLHKDGVLSEEEFNKLKDKLKKDLTL